MKPCERSAIRFQALFLASAATALAACGAEADLTASPIELQDQALFVASKRIWPAPNISLCWEDAGFEAEKSLIIGALRDSWQGASSVRFTGLERCTSRSKGLRVKLPPGAEGGEVVSLGKALDGVVNGVKIARYGTPDAPEYCGGTATREGCIREIAIHELGHALGFSHEQNRRDTPEACEHDPQGEDGDRTVGTFDWDSVMNYCNGDWGVLSATDIQGLKQFYGTGASETCGGLASGQRLAAGASISSCDGRFKLTMQKDGNLVLYKGETAVWASDTDRTSAREARMQPDGNLVLYSSGGTAVWSTGTYGNERSNLSIQIDGNLVVYSERGEAIWSSGTYERAPDGWRCGLLRGGEELSAGERMYSCDDRFNLAMQRDGNLVLYKGGLALWASGTDGSGGHVARMQADGNLVIYDASEQAVWASHTDNNPGAQLLVQNDANVVLYTASGFAAWATDTSGL